MVACPRKVGTRKISICLPHAAPEAAVTAPGFAASSRGGLCRDRHKALHTAYQPVPGLTLQVPPMLRSRWLSRSGAEFLLAEICSRPGAAAVGTGLRVGAQMGLMAPLQGYTATSDVTRWGHTLSPGRFFTSQTTGRVW